MSSIGTRRPIDDGELSPASPVEESDPNLSPPEVEFPEPTPGLDGTPVRCEFSSVRLPRT